MFYKIRVGSFDIRYSPLKENENGSEYLPCDKDGNILVYVSGTRESGYYLNEKTQEKHDKAFMLINGKAYDKFERTKETQKYKEVSVSEVTDLVNPKMYYVETNEHLYNNLKDNNKALKFGITFGGKKRYIAYVYINQLFNELFMVIGNTKISEQITDFIEAQKDKKKLQEITMVISGIDKAKIEDLIEL